MTGSPGGPDPGDPAGALLALMADLEPTLSPEAVLGALGQAAARPDGRRRIAAAVTGQPELLTGQGARAPFPGVLRFISALARVGATAVVEPACPRCGRQRPLGVPVEGLRLCAGCRSKTRALPCGRCGEVRPVARRNDGGQPICQNCWHRDPRSWKPCAKCGNSRRVAAITGAGPVCQSCRPGPALSCSICGSAGGSRIGISRATGTPVCDRCRKRWVTCSCCGTGAPLKGGTLRKPLCAHCLNPDPAFWKRCAVCQVTWQLSAAECTRCSLDRKLKQIFTPAGGTAAPELDRLREALAGVDRPDLILDWLNKAGVRRTLLGVAAHRGITHEALDVLPPGRTLVHLRSMLAAAGALPARDERLTALERWISQAITGRTDPGHRRALHGYAVWHHLRRLRGRLDGRPASRQQVKNVRDQVTAAVAFLDWLSARGLTLATCTQAELDQWLAGKSGHLARSANFVRWAVAHRHASRLTAPAARWTGPSGPLDQDRRWADARRLLNEETYPAADRVAGLLILLYAQKLNVITALTTQHVLHEDGRTLLRLGSRPIALPAPLDALVGALTTGRKAAGTSLLNVPSSWLFPGRRPGSPLTEDALAKRLHALGISPGKATAPPCSPWPPTSRPPSWPRPSASTSRRPSSGRRSPAVTGPPTPPRSAAAWNTDQMPGLPELDIARIRRWCEQRVPEHVRDQVRVECDIGPRQLTIVECRPPWREGIGPEWTRLPIARLRYTQATRMWTLYWRDRNLRFHRYDQLEPSPNIDDLLTEIDRDPTAIFWG